jgi:hypothetical protein
MPAFNVVRMRVKPEHADTFLDHTRDIAPEKLDRLRQNGLLRLIAVKTGEHSYCLLGEWASFDAIVMSRADLIGELDRTREMLEELGGELGVTDPVSGEVVMDLSLAAPAPSRRRPAARTSARKGRAAAKPRATAKARAAKPRATAKKPASRAKKTPARAAKRPAARAGKAATGRGTAGKRAGGAKRGRSARR